MAKTTALSAEKPYIFEPMSIMEVTSKFTTEISKHFSIDNGFAESEYSLAYSGGYITHQFYNIKQINTIQVEVAKYIRMDSTLTIKLVKAFIEAIVQSINET